MTNQTNHDWDWSCGLELGVAPEGSVQPEAVSEVAVATLRMYVEFLGSLLLHVAPNR